MKEGRLEKEGFGGSAAFGRAGAYRAGQGREPAAGVSLARGP